MNKETIKKVAAKVKVICPKDDILRKSLIEWYNRDWTKKVTTEGFCEWLENVLAGIAPELPRCAKEKQEEYLENALFINAVGVPSVTKELPNFKKKYNLLEIDHVHYVEDGYITVGIRFKADMEAQNGITKWLEKSGYEVAVYEDGNETVVYGVCRYHGKRVA